MSLKIKDLIKKHPAVYGSLSKIRRNVVTPLLDGHFAYYIKYLFIMRGDEIGRKKTGLTGVKPVLSREWRIGRGRDGAHRRYYTAFFKGTKCFIKVGFKDATVKNELEI